MPSMVIMMICENECIVFCCCCCSCYSWRRWCAVLCIQSGTCYKNLSSVTRKSFQIRSNKKQASTNRVGTQECIKSNYRSDKLSIRQANASDGECECVRLLFRRILMCLPIIQCCELSNNCQPLRAVNQMIHETNKYITAHNCIVVIIRRLYVKPGNKWEINHKQHWNNRQTDRQTITQCARSHIHR